MRIVQITDTHLGGEKDFTLAGINTYNSFRSVLAAVTTDQPSPALISVTGDIACDGDTSAYRHFSETMATTALPYAWLPGNHDSFDVMGRTLSDQPFRATVELGNWVAIFLNSAVPGQVTGGLADDELAALKNTLENSRQKSAVIFLHHPPVPVGCQWIDSQRVSNSAALAELLGEFDHLKAIFAGHVHQESRIDWNHIPVYSTPSTCFQFAPRSKKFEIADSPPGYRWIDLYPDGHLETGVKLVEDASQKADQHCIGY